MHSSRKYIVAILASTTLLSAGLAGCNQDAPVGTPVERAWESPSPASALAQQPAPAASQPAVVAQATRPGIDAKAAASRPAADAVAIVNGEAIDQSRLVDMLIESHGATVLEQLILLTAAKQKAAAMSVTITPEDIKRAEDDALRRIAAPVGNPDAAPLDRAASEHLLSEFLRLKGFSRSEWDCRMEQRAYLAKIAEAEIAKMEITQEMLREEYGLAYGERVQIRHIQASSPEAINKAAESLKTKSFEEMAHEFSENAITREQGGLMPPFTRHDGAVPPLIRDKAFGMQPGETSAPLREGAWYHIIKVERKFPASSVGFENVEPETLRNRLTERLTRQRIDALDTELFQSARIQIRNPRLEKQFREKHR